MKMNIDDMSTDTIRKYLEKREKEENTMREKIKTYIKDNPLSHTHEEILLSSNGVIKLPLPNCNTCWTFDVWGWVKKFVKKFPDAYPTHYSRDSTAEYQYVNVQKCLEGE